jgi:hypothetical protein
LLQLPSERSGNKRSASGQARSFPVFFQENGLPIFEDFSRENSMKNPYLKVFRFFAFYQVRGSDVQVRVLRNKRHNAFGNLAHFQLR